MKIVVIFITTYSGHFGRPLPYAVRHSRRRTPRRDWCRRRRADTGPTRQSSQGGAAAAADNEAVLFDVPKMPHKPPFTLASLLTDELLLRVRILTEGQWPYRPAATMIMDMSLEM